MSGEIHIGQLQAVNVHVGGQNQSVTGESGTFNNYADPLAVRAELQSMLDELLRVMTDDGTVSTLRASAEQARVEADEPQPRGARLKQLMDAVVMGAGKAGSVAQAALNVLAVINKLPR